MTDNLKGTLWMLAAVGALTVMAVTLKHIVTDMSPWQAAWLRMSIGLGFLTPWVFRTGIRKAILSPRLPMLWARGLFGSASFALTVYALGHLILADAVVLSFTTPSWVIPLAALFFRRMRGLAACTRDGSDIRKVRSSSVSEKSSTTAMPPTSGATKLTSTLPLSFSARMRIERSFAVISTGGSTEPISRLV